MSTPTGDNAFLYELELTVSSDCEDWVVYDMENAGVCVEPWTSPPNPSPRRATR